MRIGIQTWGSDGDIRPLIALGGGLQRAGHQVTITITSVDDKDYADICGSLGLNYIKVPERIGANLSELAYKAQNKRNPVKLLKLLFDLTFFPFVEKIYQASLEMCAANDLLIGHFFLYPLKVACIRAKKPFVSATYWPPIIPTLCRPPEPLPNMGRLLNRLAWRICQYMIDSTLRTEIDRLWLREGLPRLRHVFPDAWFSSILNLLPTSPSLWQRQPDWGVEHQICGFFNMPPSAEPWDMPLSLREFLASGERPVFMTFGTTQKIDPERSVSMLVSASRLARCRAIVNTTSKDYPSDSQIDGIYFVGQVPHEVLLPHCAAVLHHGGAGTTQTTLRCGLPSVVVPFMDEQMSWGRRLESLGVGASPVHYRRVTPEKLASRVRFILDEPSLKQRARLIGHSLQAEDGVSRAIELIEETIQRLSS